ncbi:unnamed protein product [Phytomonas sp. EM1]|nr:unnamed protein product [Phytomonas sp. EM1]|eukprot:CCW63529.1 unnamed protein product [Phytomonas sp. isolate EM1]
MKVLPRGPIIRITPPSSHAVSSSKTTTTAAALGFGRDDWATGRDISVEERRCGILLGMREIAPRRAAASTTALAPPSLPLFDAVVKGQTSDFQVNEITSNAAAAFLTKEPKARWRKISRQKTLLVENAREPFSNPTKSFSPLVQSHGEYVRLLGRLPSEEPVLQFVVYRDGAAIPDLLNRFRYEIGVEKAAVHLRETPGGFHGCISQFGTCVGVTKEQLAHVSRHYNLHPLIMDPRGYHRLEAWPSLTAPPHAYFYRLLLRCVEGEEGILTEALRRWKETGFVNYFGMEHFGLGENAMFDLAAFAARGAVDRALGCYLQSLADANPFHHGHFMAYVNAERGSAAGIMEQWASESRGVRATPAIQRVLRALHRYHAEANAEAKENDRQGEPTPPHETKAASTEEVGAIAWLEKAWRELGVEGACRRSAAEFVWNAMASQRLLSYGGEVVVGDLVRVAKGPIEQGENAPNGETSANDGIRRVETSAEARSFTLADVVLPVPYPGSDLTRAVFPAAGALTSGLFEDFARRHHLEFLFHPPSSETGERRGVVYRPVIRKPLRVSAAVLRDPSSFTALKSDRFLRQERKAIEGLELDYHGRVREPCVFNLPERFAERMALVRRHHAGEASVAVSFVLPAEASPWVALREVFAMKYLHFTDLYFTQRRDVE